MEPPTRLKELTLLLVAVSCGLAQEIEPASRVYAQASKSVFMIVITSATGEPIGRATGFSIGGNKIVTNEHVVRAGTPYLDLGSNRIPLKVFKIDPFNDIALLVPEGELSSVPLKFSASQPKPGATVFALGNPAGLERSISSGIVAGIRNIGGRELLQISAPISPGSSGGPVLTANAEVIGVTVGMLESGQNLNFAVPASVVLKLMGGDNGKRGDVAEPQRPVQSAIVDSNDTAKPNVHSLLAGVNKVRGQQQGYSTKGAETEIETLLEQALQTAGSDSSDLAAVADKALRTSFSLAHMPSKRLAVATIAVTASQRLVAAKPSVGAYITLAKSIEGQYAGQETHYTDKENPTLKRAEIAVRAAFKLTKQPTLEMYMVLADILQDRSMLSESRAAYLRAYDIARSQKDDSALREAIQGLITTSSSLRAFTESDRWFQLLTETEQGAMSFDWERQADSQLARNDFTKAGDGYRKAAAAAQKEQWGPWPYLCSAAKAYFAASGTEDRVLETARGCIENGAGIRNSDE